MAEHNLGFWGETIKSIASVWEFFAALVAALVAAVSGWIGLRSHVRQHQVELVRLRKDMIEHRQFVSAELERLESDRAQIVAKMYARLDTLSKAQVEMPEMIITRLIAHGIVADPKYRNK